MDFLTLLSPAVQAFIREHEHEDPAALMLQARRWPQIPVTEAVQQIAARQKARKKLPEWYQTPGLLFPPALSLEQSSSEATARYKASLVSGKSAADITGGFGVDCYYLAQRFGHMQYVEQQPHLARLAQHNFARLGAGHIQVHNQSAIDFLQNQTEKLSCIYLDPARRDEHQGKVFRLEDCEPNVVQLLPLLFKKAETVLLKTAPLLDIDLAIASLGQVEKVWVVALAGECREVLYLLKSGIKPAPEITAVNLAENAPALTFSFTRKKEAESVVEYADPLRFLYEPNAAIMKAGAFKAIAEAFNLKKLHPSSHLYTSEELVPEFPGRSFTIEQVVRYSKKEIQAAVAEGKANITARNFHDSVAEIRKKTGLREGGEKYLFATTGKTNRPIVVICRKAE